MENDKWFTEKKLVRTILWCWAGVTFFCMIFGLIAYCNKDVIDEFGQFGDSFNTLNVLFTGFSFSALVIALIIQQKELRLALVEAKESRLAQVEANSIQDSTNTKLYMLNETLEKVSEAQTASLGNQTVANQIMEEWVKQIKELIENFAKSLDIQKEQTKLNALSQVIEMNKENFLNQVQSVTNGGPEVASNLKSSLAEVGKQVLAMADLVKK